MHNFWEKRKIKILLPATRIGLSRRKSFKWLCLSETFRNGSQYGEREQKQINDHHHRLLDLRPRPFPGILGNIPPGTFILFCKHGDISNWVKIETCSADPGPAHDREWPPTSPRTTLHRPHGLNCSSFLHLIRFTAPMFNIYFFLPGISIFNPFLPPQGSSITGCESLERLQVRIPDISQTTKR